MKIYKATHRYAKTLFLVAQEQDQLEKVYGDMKTIGKMFASEPRLSKFINSPLQDTSRSLALLTQSLEGRLQPLTQTFIQLLAQKSRLRLLENVPQSFEELYERHKNIVRARVISAYDLSEEQKERITQKLRETFSGGSITLDCRTDKSLLAGFKIVVGDNVIDANVKHKISLLKKKLAI